MKIMVTGPIISWQIDGGKVETVTDFIFLGFKITADSAEIRLRDTWKENYDKSRQHIKKQRHHFADKGLYDQSYGFSHSHVWIWELNVKSTEESILLNWIAGEDSWESLGRQDQANKS